MLGCGCAAIASLTLNAAESIYPGNFSPETHYNDAPNRELGTIFRPTLPGRITQVRVYALTEETGSQAVRDPQWDVSTAAAHALGRLMPPAIDALDELLREAPGQEYLNVIAADCLGGLQAVKAVPRLVRLASRAQDSMVRLAALRALAKIASAPEADLNTILPALVRGLADQEGTVIAATIEALIPLESKTGQHRLAVVQALKACVRNPNPLVSAAAHNALAAAYKD